MTIAQPDDVKAAYAKVKATVDALRSEVKCCGLVLKGPRDTLINVWRGYVAASKNAPAGSPTVAVAVVAMTTTADAYLHRRRTIYSGKVRIVAGDGFYKEAKPATFHATRKGTFNFVDIARQLSAMHGKAVAADIRRKQKAAAHARLDADVARLIYDNPGFAARYPTAEVEALGESVYVTIRDLSLEQAREVVSRLLKEDDSDADRHASGD